MFGCIVSGRLVQTEFQQVTENQFVLNLADPDKIQHIVIFLVGTLPFPDGMGGAVFFSWPSPLSSWQFLGFISNNKPSAIFKVSQLHTSSDTNPFGNNMTSTDHTMAQIGISVEPLNQLAQQTPALNSAPSTMSSHMEFVMKMLDNFVNYVTSFGLQQSQMTPKPQETYVPLGVVQQWLEKFKKRITIDPDFWKK